ncbi:MAG TPA: lipocalin family protein [Flavisolibacter sp.]
MKAILLTILIFCLITRAFAQNKQSPSERREMVKLLCQKWVLTTMSAQGKIANVPASKAMYVTYKPDGNFTDSSARFSVSHGTWTYDSETQILYTTEKVGKAKAKVVKLTPTELTVEMEYPTVTMAATYKRAD